MPVCAGVRLGGTLGSGGLLLLLLLTTTTKNGVAQEMLSIIDFPVQNHYKSLRNGGARRCPPWGNLGFPQGSPTRESLKESAPKVPPRFPQKSSLKMY